MSFWLDAQNLESHPFFWSKHAGRMICCGAGARCRHRTKGRTWASSSSPWETKTRNFPHHSTWCSSHRKFILQGTAGVVEATFMKAPKRGPWTVPYVGNAFSSWELSLDLGVFVRFLGASVISMMTQQKRKEFSIVMANLKTPLCRTLNGRCFTSKRRFWAPRLVANATHPVLTTCQGRASNAASRMSTKHPTGLETFSLHQFLVLVALSHRGKCWPPMFKMLDVRWKIIQTTATIIGSKHLDKCQKNCKKNREKNQVKKKHVLQKDLENSAHRSFGALMAAKTLAIAAVSSAAQAKSSSAREAKTCEKRWLSGGWKIKNKNKQLSLNYVRGWKFMIQIKTYETWNSMIMITTILIFSVTVMIIMVLSKKDYMYTSRIWDSVFFTSLGKIVVQK